MTDIDIGYSLDPSGYLAGVNQIDQANQRLQATFGQTATLAGGVGRALSLVTPGRATLAGLALFAQQAAQSQQNLSTLSATASVTGVRVDALSKGIRSMSREMPLGSQGSRALVEQFTRMGVAGEGSEKKIVRLSTAVAKLSGATGENAQGLAQGMVDLARATGNTNLDPKRFEAIGDSLTTISAKSGASATSILQFSKNIAPMAQASGIGATGILGISSAFAKLGEDGFGASTAVNKMLTDMNRAVRDGGPEMKTYAQIVGKSADEFERMFKSNPAEALTQVTEAVAKAGPGGPRMLEQIGVEGVRGQRSLQALVASGGLRPAIEEASKGYGSGATDKAAEAAFGGLNDSLGQLSEASQQVAQAFGAPLLQPLTTFADALTKATGGIAEVAKSDTAQNIMKVGVYGGLGVMGAKALAGPLGVAMFGRQTATSGIGRAIAAGLASGADMDPNSRTARYGRQITEAREAGTLRSGPMGRARDWMFSAAEGFAQTWRQKNPAGEGPSFLDRTKGNAAAWATNLSETYTNMLRGQAKNARVPVMDRDDTFKGSFSGGFRQAWSAARSAASEDPTQSKLGAFGKGMDAFNDKLRDSAKGLDGLKSAGMSAATALLETGKFGGRLAADTAVTAGRGLGRIASAIGPEAGLAAVMAAGAFFKSRSDAKATEREEFLSKDISGTINSYRESIGKAVDATQTFGSVAEQMNKNLAQAAKFKDFASVKEVTDADVVAANESKDKITARYAGSSEDIAATIQATSPGGMTPEELQAVKVDLARQLGRSQVSEIMQLIPASFEAKSGQGGLTSEQMPTMVSQIAGAASQNQESPWYANALSGIIGGGPMPGGPNGMDALSQSANTPGWLRQLSAMKGGGADFSELGAASQQQIGAINEGVAQQYSTQVSKFQPEYAEQERAKSINAALKEAFDSNNADVFMALSSKFGAQLGGEDVKDVMWDPKAFEAAGFDFTKMVAEQSKAYGETRAQAESRNAVFTGKGGIEAQLQEQAYTKDIRARSSFLGDVFDVRSTSPAAKAMSESMGAPEDVKKQAAAMDAVVQASDKAGKSMADLAIEASRSASAMAEGSDQWARLKEIQARAEFEMGSRAVTSGATASETQMEQYRYYSQLANQTPTTEAEKASVQGARENVVAMRQQFQQRLVARLQMQRQADVAESRAREDFERQQEYSKRDFAVQTFRLERNFERSEARSKADFQRQQGRAEADFATQRMRQLRDFNIAAERAEADYQKSRMRQFRDFNIALARQIEDAAKTMLDPYQRIQTKATWDVQNLMVNLNEQTAAMEKQKAQLEQLRKMGLSAQSIDMLGLGKTENAQQVNNLVADASPEAIEALNAATAKKAAAAGALYTDQSNTDLKRQKEDFNKALADQREDFLKSMERQNQDLRKSMADAAKDFAKASKRARQDFATQLARSRQDLQTTLSDMATDRSTAMSRAKRQLDVNLARMAQDVKMADQTIAGNMSDLAEQVNRAIHGKAVNWQKIVKNDTQSWVRVMQASVIPQLNKAFGAMGLTAKDISTTGTSSGGGKLMTGGGKPIAYADGGHVDGTSPHERADDVDAKLTSGEWVHPVKAVKHYGHQFMEAVRTRRFPKDVAVQYLADGGMVYKQMEAWTKKNLPGVAITSSYRPGAITALGNVSMHAQGKALDLAPSMSTFNKILGTFGKNINQLFYSPADGRTILRGKPWRMDATTKAGHWDHVHWAMQQMTGMAGGALGMDPAALSAIFAKAPRNGNLQTALTNKAFAALSAKLAAAMEPGAGGTIAGYNGPEDVSRWGGDVSSVLQMLSRPAKEAPAVLRRIQFESGGNPRAINLWDSNAKAGIPSKGLMQVIDPTFKAYRSRGLPNDIWNPRANIYAGSNYAVKRYGSLAAIDPKVRPKGYDEGGWMEPGEGKHVNGTAKPEAVLTNTQWRDVKKLAEKAGHSISKEELRGVNAACGIHLVVNNNQHYAYDQRNDFNGAEITVVSQDPDDMGRKLERKIVQSRLTQTRGVVRSS